MVHASVHRVRRVFWYDRWIVSGVRAVWQHLYAMHTVMKCSQQRLVMRRQQAWWFLSA